MEIAEIVLAVLVSLASIVVMVVILMQSGKEDGLSSVMGGSSDTYMSKNKKKSMEQMLASATKWIALVWIALILIMSLV